MKGARATLAVALTTYIRAYALYAAFSQEEGAF